MNKSIVYTIGNNIYINLTNYCPCRCVFCIRQNGDSIGDSDNLWLETEPSAEDVISELKKYKLSDYEEAIFCGYGEPTGSLEILLKTAEWLKSQGIKKRLNTNGLSDLINNRPTAPLMSVFDTVSISLNASNSDDYDRICRPKFKDAFKSLLNFAKECKKYVPQVLFTIVDTVCAGEIDDCRRIAELTGVKLRIREFILPENQ